MVGAAQMSPPCLLPTRAGVLPPPVSLEAGLPVDSIWPRRCGRPLPDLPWESVSRYLNDTVAFTDTFGSEWELIRWDVVRTGRQGLGRWGVSSLGPLCWILPSFTK